MKNQHAITQKNPKMRNTYIKNKTCLFMNVSGKHVNKTSPSTNEIYVASAYALLWCCCKIQKVIRFKLTHTTKQWNSEFGICVPFTCIFTLLETANKWRNKTWEWNKSKIHHGDFQPLSPYTTSYEQQQQIQLWLNFSCKLFNSAYFVALFHLDILKRNIRSVNKNRCQGETFLPF